MKNQRWANCFIGKKNTKKDESYEDEAKLIIYIYIYGKSDHETKAVAIKIKLMRRQKRISLAPCLVDRMEEEKEACSLLPSVFFFYDLCSISPSLEEKSGKWTTWQLSDKASIHWSPFKGGMGLDWHDYERTTPPFLMGFQFLTRVDKTLIHTTHCQLPTAKILHLVSSCLGFIYDCHLGFHGSFQPFNHMSFVFLHACPHLPHLISSPTFYMHAQPFNTI